MVQSLKPIKTHFSKKDISNTKTLIQKAKRITLLTHFKPDGDGISACAALSHIFEKLGKKVETIYPNKSEFKIKRKPKNVFINKHKQTPDLIFALDTANIERLYFPKEFEPIKLINIDHHISNSLESDYNFVDANASSTCEILTILLSHWLSEEMDQYCAQCLLFGILADTQVFHTQAVSPEILKISAQLMELGADFYELKTELLSTKNPKIIALWGDVMSNIKNSKSGKAVWAIIKSSDLKKHDVQIPSLIGFNNFLSQISGVDVTLLFYQRNDGKTKVSLRSKKTDVNKLAAKFGGGGHKNAAGILSDIAIDKLVKELTKGL